MKNKWKTIEFSTKNEKEGTWMEKQVIFKSALNGFEKSAVLKYIDEMNSKYAASVKEYQQQAEELENEKYELSDQLTELKQALTELQKKAESEQALLLEQLQTREELIESLKTEMKALAQKNEEQEHELIMQREQNRLIREQAESIEAKSKKYDEAAASIGTVILSARQDAEKIIAEAQAKADSITANAQKEADQIVANAESNLSGLQKQMDSMKAQFFSIREQMNSSVALLNDQFGQVEASLSPAEEPKAEEPKTEAAPAAEPVEEIKAEHPLKAILEQASAVNNQKKNFFR